MIALYLMICVDRIMYHLSHPLHSHYNMVMLSAEVKY